MIRNQSRNSSAVFEKGDTSRYDGFHLIMTQNKYARARQEISRVAQTIVRHYRPDKILLFGSFAYGNPRSDSDIDLLIVKNTRKRIFERIKDVIMMVDSNYPIEPLVYTPREIEKRLSMGDFFMNEITTRGIPLYEKE